jgi:hypothetical protein
MNIAISHKPRFLQCPWCHKKILIFPGEMICGFCDNNVSTIVRRGFYYNKEHFRISYIFYDVRKLKPKYCKFCGIRITAGNRYKNTVCNDKRCVRMNNKVCDDDCFNCVYPDCRVSPAVL